MRVILRGTTRIYRKEGVLASSDDEKYSSVPILTVGEKIPDTLLQIDCDPLIIGIDTVRAEHARDEFKRIATTTYQPFVIHLIYAENLADILSLDILHTYRMITLGTYYGFWQSFFSNEKVRALPLV